MYDPVLNRPMFQGPSSTAQGSSTPSAKGTGITSMVTAPDQGAQQLKTFSTQIAPTIRSFAEGGYLSDSSSPMQGQNPLQSSISQAIDQSLYQQPQGYAEGGVASMWDNFVKSLRVEEPNRSGNYRLPDVGLRIGQQNDYRKDAGITAGNSPNYVEPIDIGGREAVISPEVYSEITRPTSEERRAEAKRNIDSYEPPPPAASPFGRGVQRFFGQDAAGVEESKRRAQEVSDAALAREDALRKREALRSQYEEAVNKNPTSIFDYFGPMSDEELNKKQEARRQAEEAVLRQTRPTSVQNFENPYRNDNTSDRFEREQIERMKGPPPPPPVPQERPPVEERSSISTELAKIKAERAAQSAAERRENALMALMSAGFGMAAGKSRHALQNIAEGGQQGIGTFAQLEKGRREDENRRYLSALHEKEVALRERELAAREPLIAAQTEAQKSIPAYREQLNENRKFTANANAQARVEVAMKNILGNPTDPRAREIMADKTNTKKAILEKQLHDKFFIEELRKPTESSQSDPYGIRSLDKSTGGE